jgi:hypothetical protein
VFLTVGRVQPFKRTIEPTDFRSRAHEPQAQVFEQVWLPAPISTIVYSPGVKCLFSAATSPCRLHLDPTKPCSQAQEWVRSERISCVFLCIFLLLQKELRGYALQLSSQLRLAYKDFRARACAGFARLQLLLHEFSLLSVASASLWRIAVCGTVAVRCGGIDSSFVIVL